MSAATAELQMRSKNKQVIYQVVGDQKKIKKACLYCIEAFSYMFANDT